MLFYFAIVTPTPDSNGLYQIRGWDTQEADTADAARALVQERATPYHYDAVCLPKMTEAQWTIPFRVNFELAIKNRGTEAQEIVDYTPSPPPPPPLKYQAQAAMQNVQQQASMVTAMGEAFGPQMRDYVGRLREIVSGTDTTSTTLPTAPNDPTD